MERFVSSSKIIKEIYIYVLHYKFINTNEKTNKSNKYDYYFNENLKHFFSPCIAICITRRDYKINI